MFTRKTVLVTVLVPCWLFVVTRPLMSQEQTAGRAPAQEGLGPESIILDGSSLDLTLRALANDAESVHVFPLFAAAVPTESSGIELELQHASQAVNADGVAVLDYESPTAHLHLLPFDAHKATRTQDWDRINKNLRDENNAMVSLESTGLPVTEEGLSRRAVRDAWNGIFDEYSVVRAVAIDGTLYVKPTAHGAAQIRQQVLDKYMSDLRNLQDEADVDNAVDTIDLLFKEVSDRGANSDALNMLATVWATSLRAQNLGGDQDSLRTGDLAKFARTTEAVLSEEFSRSASQCLVTVSTTGGPAAEIRYRKTRLQASSYEYFGYSKATGFVERALWTFISRRLIDGQVIETGRNERVRCREKGTLEIVIVERSASSP